MRDRAEDLRGQMERNAREDVRKQIMRLSELLALRLVRVRHQGRYCIATSMKIFACSTLIAFP